MQLEVPKAVFLLVVGARFCDDEDGLYVFEREDDVLAYKLGWEPFHDSAVEVVKAPLRHVMLDTRVALPDKKLVLVARGHHEVLWDPVATIH